MFSTFFFVVLYCIFFVTYSETTILPSACNDLSDGTYSIKLLEDNDDCNVVQIQCSNGYMMLNVNKDKNLEKCFSSWAKWHYAIAGPTNDDHVNWAQWFLGDDGNTKYLVSPSCDVCDESDTTNNDLGTDTTYYMTGNLFGCWWWIRGLHDCDMDWNTYECYACECDDGACHGTSMEDSDATTGICATKTRSSTADVATTHDLCTRDTNLSFKPSLGTDGRFCVCAKPSTVQYYEVDNSLISGEQTTDTTNEAQTDTTTTDEPVNVELYQSDFLHGTYRITKSGTYTIMEDITFDFNAGTANEDGAWLPHSDQEDDYPGAGQYRDPYFMGFFAGITIETKDVILNLNGHTLQQSEPYYHQQRWFSIIELANQPFMPGQGPGFFGGDPVMADGATIKDGTLGLTSHHAIHGNRCKNIVIENVIIKDFETHGIQINGFENVEIRNVEIGPSSQKAYLLGEYGHARMILPRLRKIQEENPTGTIQFYGRDSPVTIKELADELETQIDMAFNYVLHGVEHSEDDENYNTWLKAKENFINEDGIPYGSGMYGLFFSYPGANVFGYAHSDLRSSNAVVENVKIHNLYHKMYEYLRFHSGIPFYVNPFNAVFDVEAAMSDVTDVAGATYVGNLMTDIYLAMNKLSDNFGYLQMQMLKNDGLVAWAVGAKSLDPDDITVTCNADVMTHSGKGIAGFRVDGVDNVVVSNLEIYELYDYSTVGSEKCGEYEAGGGNIQGGHFLQKRPMQMGFSGNMMQGISVDYCEVSMSDIYVHDIGSATGLAFGMSIWPGTELSIDGDVTVTNVRAGFQLEKDTYSFEDRPNKAPEACAIRVYWQYNGDSASIEHNSGDITTECVVGHVSCFEDSSYQGSMLGFYQSCSKTEKVGGLNDDELDISSTLTMFDSRMSLMDPKESKKDFMKYVSFSNIAGTDDSDDSSTKKNKLKSQHALNSSTHRIGRFMQLFMMIFPIIMIVIYILWTRYISRGEKMYQYTKLSTSENHTNYGTIN